jgi:hypothetical protein
MSSIGEMQPVDAEIKDLEGMIQGVSSKEYRDILEAQLLLIKASSVNASPDQIRFAVQLLRKWVPQIQGPRPIKKVFRLILPIRASVRD